MDKIHIIDSGTCNLGSVSNMLDYIGVKNVVTSKKEELIKAKKIILPGVGAFEKNLENLHKLKIFEPIKELVIKDKVPILGICLGMQLFCKGSEEGIGKGFGFIDADVLKFRFSGNTKNKWLIPHMGWNSIKLNKKSKIATNLDNQTKFYFVHSYHVNCRDESDILFKTEYGYEFVSGIEKQNIFGIQFHPEKSHKYGMRLLKNFSQL